MSKINRKNFFLYLFIIVIFINLTSCNDEEDFFEPNYLDISRKAIHPIEIRFDFYTYDKLKENIKNEIYFSRIKNLLLNSAKLFKQFLKVENQKYISTNLNISLLCHQNIPFYDKIIKTGIKTDLVIYPIISEEEKVNEEDYIKGGICAIDDDNLRPIIAYIKIYSGFNFNRKNSDDKFIMLIMHQLTHILGFNKNIISRLSKGNKSLFKITHYKKKNFISGQTLASLTEIVYGKFYFIGVELNSPDGNYTGHWNPRLSLNDYMKPLNYSQSLITHLTLNLLGDLGWYSFIHSSCNLYKKIEGEYCVKYNNTCSYDLNERVQLYIHEGNLHCNVLLKKPNICINELEFIDEFREKVKSSEIKKICKNNITSYEREVMITNFPELKRVKSQIVRIIKPSKICKNPQRTIFFPYSPIVKMKQNITSIPVRINNIKNMMVALQDFESKTYSPPCLKDTLSYAQFVRSHSIEQNSNLIWVNVPWKKKYNHKFIKYQRFNHFLNHSQITRKDLLYKNFMRMKKNFSEDFNYMAVTYTLPRDYKKVQKHFKNYTPKPNYLWLLKPSGSARGEGIKFMQSFSDVPKNLTILTRYIHNPHLLKGRKYDLRVYIFVTGHQPLKIYVYNEGIVRIATEQYNLDTNDLTNLYKHLTNVALNQKSEKFKENDKNDQENTNIWSFSMLREQYKKEGKDFNELFKKIQDIAVKSIISMHEGEIYTELKSDYILKSNNLFELYGMDILVDQDLNPWLLEINLSPSLSGVGDYEQRIKNKLFSDMFNILGFVPFSHINGKPLEKENTYKNDIEEAVEDTICEFTRPNGGFVRSFPRKDNIDYYKKFFTNPIETNLLLWEKIIEYNL